MSLKITCDHDGCLTAREGGDVVTLRHILHREGWEIGRGDRCPKHKRRFRILGPKPDDYEWNGQRITHYVNHDHTWQSAPADAPKDSLT